MDTPSENQTLSYTGSMSCLVGVQPMKGPVDLCYIMRYKHPSDSLNEPPVLNGEVDAAQQDDVKKDEDDQPTVRTMRLEVISVAVQASTFKLFCHVDDHEKINEEIDKYIITKILKAKEPTVLKTSNKNEIFNVVTYQSSQIAAKTRRGFGNIILYNEEDKDVVEYAVSQVKNSQMVAVMSDACPKHHLIIGYKGVTYNKDGSVDNTSQIDCGLLLAPYTKQSTNTTHEQFTVIANTLIRIAVAAPENWENYYEVIRLDHAK